MNFPRFVSTFLSIPKPSKSLSDIRIRVYALVLCILMNSLLETSGFFEIIFPSPTSPHSWSHLTQSFHKFLILLLNLLFSERKLRCINSLSTAFTFNFKFTTSLLLHSLKQPIFVLDIHQSVTQFNIILLPFPILLMLMLVISFDTCECGVLHFTKIDHLLRLYDAAIVLLLFLNAEVLVDPIIV